MSIGFPAQGQWSSTEAWSELQLHYRLNERTRLIGMGSTSRYRDSGAAYDGQLGIVFDHRALDWLSLRGGYRHGFALDGSSYYEDRALVEQTLHSFWPARVQADFRTREDLRWLNSGFSVRLRERLTVQRDFQIGSYTFTPYTAAEIFFDSRFGQFNRYRLAVGATLPLHRRLSIEPYVARQSDFYPSFADVNALGLVVTLAF